MDEKSSAQGETAIVVHPAISGNQTIDVENRLQEAAGLARAIDIDPVKLLSFRIRQVNPATLFGAGQIEQIGASLAAHEAGLLFVDGPLSAIQQRNLEERLQVKVVDRTGLILEIFGARAQSAEGRLQVELAHLDYQSGRLVRSWTHLERQRGGFGFLGGPGETQIEADRRMIRDRMARLRRELDGLRKTRSLHRARRERAPWPVIALVGYTNAGKSTLFNRLTGDRTFAKDLLFATLDTKVRELDLAGFDKAVLTDTVGFITDLPTQLVAAFRATLEEITAASLIIHVRDMSDPDRDSHKRDVESILTDIGVDLLDEGAIPLIEAWNKVDLLSAEERRQLQQISSTANNSVLVSAKTGEGCDELLADAAALLSRHHIKRKLLLSGAAGRELAWLHENGEVLVQEAQDDMIALTVRMSKEDWGRFDQLSD